MKLSLILIFLFFNLQSPQQFTTHDLFLCDIGIAKFNALNSLNSNKSVSDIYENGWWCTFETSSGEDSIYKTSISYSRNNYPGCSKVLKSSYSKMYFIDQTLCKNEVVLFFEPADYQNCIAAYNYWGNIFEQKFRFIDRGIFAEDEKSRNQIGEFSTFYNSVDHYQKDKKNDVGDIHYKMVYKKEKNEFGVLTYKTGEIDSYMLVISYTNSKGTKLRPDDLKCEL